MARPTPTASQTAALEADKAKQENAATTFAAAATAQDVVIAEKALLDSAFKDQFDWFNDDIIGQYDAERRALDGTYIASPIVEADILAAAELDGSGRITPSLPAKDIVRIDEFDGSNTTTDSDNESQHITDQANLEDILANGVSGTSPTVTGTSVTNSALTAASTTLDMIDTVGPMSFSIGDVFVVQDGGSDAAVVEVTGVTDNAGGDPPYDITLDIIFHVAPTGTISAGADIESSFGGFTDGERTSKTASDSNLQPLMDALISSLETELNARIANLATQLTALGLNDDPDGTAEIATATTNATTSDSFIDTYLLTTDVSDTGLASLASERATRSSQISTRIAQIVANYTGQTLNYYDERYNFANNRANSERGTLRIQKNAETVKDSATALADSAQDAADAADDILGL